MRSSRGYMLVELLVGAAITLAVSAVLFLFAIATQAAVATQGSAADQQQRLRVAVEQLRHDLVMAGAGPSRGAGRGPLIRALPPVVPARMGVSSPDPELTVRDDRITIMYVPESRAQTILRSAMAAASSPLAIDGSAPGCVPVTACDFAAGDRAVIYDASHEGGAHEVLTVAAIDAARGLLTPTVPLSRAYPAGARVALVTLRNYYFDAANKRLMVYDGDRSDLPLIDRVADLRFAYFADPRPDALLTIPLSDLGGTVPQLLGTGQLTDGPVVGESPYRFDADLLRVRRIRVTLRLQSESPPASLRDLESTIEISPPNMAAR
jgi:hypothetical protein